MTVAELIEELQKYPSNLKVLVSSDPEGNTIRELYDVDQFLFLTGSSGYGEIDLVDESDRHEYEDDELETGVVLWP